MMMMLKFPYLNCCLVGFLENFPKSRLAEARYLDSKTMPRWILMRRYLPMLFHSSYFCSHYVLCLCQNNNSDVTQYSTDKFFSSSKFFKISLVAATFYLAIISIMHLKHSSNFNLYTKLRVLI